MSATQEKTLSTKTPTKKISGKEMVDCEELRCDEDNEEGSSAMLAEPTTDALGKTADPFVDAAAMKRLEAKMLKLEQRNDLMNAKLTEIVKSIDGLSNRVRNQEIQCDNLRCMKIRSVELYHKIEDHSFKAKRDIRSLQNENNHIQRAVDNDREIIIGLKSEISELKKTVETL